MEVYWDAKEIIREAIDAVLPDNAVRNALEKWEFLDNVYVAAVGKAAWKMAKVTQKLWKDRIKKRNHPDKVRVREAPGGRI